MSVAKSDRVSSLSLMSAHVQNAARTNTDREWLLFCCYVVIANHGYDPEKAGYWVVGEYLHALWYGDHQDKQTASADDDRPQY